MAKKKKFVWPLNETPAEKARSLMRTLKRERCPYDKLRDTAEWFFSDINLSESEVEACLREFDKLVLIARPPLGPISLKAMVAPLPERRGFKG